eukprot:4337219-Lingulodinium_polyedra.AAC.1
MVSSLVQRAWRRRPDVMPRREALQQITCSNLFQARENNKACMWSCTSADQKGIICLPAG